MTTIHKTGTLGMKNVNNRNKILKLADEWLEDKKMVDGAEGLWRVYYKLYDLTDYIDRHPGGKFWLEISKGLDITEAFESYHLSTKPEKILEKFFVRTARSPRNAPFTFEEGGFYKTLKQNVRSVWNDIPKKDIEKSKHIIDLLFLSAVIFLVMATAYTNYFIGYLAGITFSFVNICAYNFYHQKDNFRSYYGDIGMSPSREFRIIHIFSHHFYPNSVLDIQNYLLEPLLQVYPQKKTVVLKYFSYVYGPLVLWPLIFLYLQISKYYYWLVRGYTRHITKAHFLPWTLPLLSYLITNQPILIVLQMWLFCVLVSGFWFSLIGLATSHLHPDIFIDGDTPRTAREMDWGINQLDTVGDKVEVAGSQFLSMISFGDHAVHHLFPSLDQGAIRHLYPVLEKTLKQFDLDFRIVSIWDLIAGYFLLLSKEVGNPNPPSLTKKKFTI